MRVQDAYSSWSQKQAQQLEDLDVLVGGSVQLLEAFAAVESAAQPNKQLKVRLQAVAKLFHVKHTCDS